MAAAVRLLSPVIIITSSPICFIVSMACRLVGLMVSATAITPSTRVLSAKYSGVFPSFASASACRIKSPVSMCCSSISCALPAKYVCPSHSAQSPRPDSAVNFSGAVHKRPFSLARCTIAPDSGCSLGASSEAANRSSVSSVHPSAHTTSVTCGLPSVMVPVLSSTTVCTVCAVSSASADLINTPYSAPLPVPTIIATGVANPSAHGQEITSTEIAVDSANSPVCPKISQTIAETAAMLITTGTNTPLILSASLAIGALELAACSTSAMIWESVVSLPTFCARQVNTPVPFIEADSTVSPSAFSTGMLSPVSALWSMAECPLITTPSTGTPAPGRTKKTSPTFTCSSGTCTSCPQRSTVAVLGARLISFSIASPVLPLLRVSRYLPSVISVKIIAADSKYKSII